MPVHNYYTYRISHQKQENGLAILLKCNLRANSLNAEPANIKLSIQAILGPVLAYSTQRQIQNKLLAAMSNCTSAVVILHRPLSNSVVTRITRTLVRCEMICT